MFCDRPFRVDRPIDVSKIGSRIAISNPYTVIPMRIVVARNPLIMASDAGSNLTGVDVSGKQ